MGKRERPQLSSFTRLRVGFYLLLWRHEQYWSISAHSCSCRSKLAQRLFLRTSEIASLAVLEVRVLRPFS